MSGFGSLGHTCVVGLQWGDEGKGKIVDVMLEDFDVVVRYGGGANAGHTVVIGGERFALHQLPSGVLRPNVISVVTGGVVLDPTVVLGEISSLRGRGVAVGENLRISERAHVVLPYHRLEDQLAESAAGSGARLGTTSRGIGPCYSDKMSRRYGIRVCDLYRPERLRERLGQVVAHKNAYFRALFDHRQPLDAEQIAREYLGFGEQLRPFVCDTATLLNGLIGDGRRVLFEGAQGALLDVDHGTYPYVTSSNAGAGGACSGAGVPPTVIRATMGVVKAYSTRVGAGPFPTELKDATGDEIRERGREYGTTTGRPRRCGWFDAVAARYSAMVCGATDLAVMHLDTLSEFDAISVCVGYAQRGNVSNRFPADAYEFDEIQPVYETLSGWSGDLGRCRRFDELPENARRYVQRLSELLGVRLSVISVGPQRDQTMLLT
ncbi:MAG: Adenylosuccinate synthetase [Phycisphaerae bacterium]|nr:Adenylosuccinate synthetase [Phycisphaerae bacterium]